MAMRMVKREKMNDSLQPTTRHINANEYITIGNVSLQCTSTTALVGFKFQIMHSTNMH